MALDHGTRPVIRQAYGDEVGSAHGKVPLVHANGEVPRSGLRRPSQAPRPCAGVSFRADSAHGPGWLKDMQRMAVADTWPVSNRACAPGDHSFAEPKPGSSPISLPLLNQGVPLWAEFILELAKGNTPHPTTTPPLPHHPAAGSRSTLSKSCRYASGDLPVRLAMRGAEIEYLVFPPSASPVAPGCRGSAADHSLSTVTLHAPDWISKSPSSKSEPKVG
jgi:hypothetical protein